MRGGARSTPILTLLIHFPAENAHLGKFSRLGRLQHIQSQPGFISFASAWSAAVVAAVDGMAQPAAALVVTPHSKIRLKRVALVAAPVATLPPMEAVGRAARAAQMAPAQQVCFV